MVTKSTKTGAKKGRVKVGRLKLNRETVKDLTTEERKKVKGGAKPTARCTLPTDRCLTMPPGCA